MVLTKEEIWERIRVKSVWLTEQRTPLFASTDDHMGGTVALPTLTERYIRYIVSLLFQGNAIVAQSGSIEKYEEAGTYTMKWSDIQIAPASMPQIPEGSYSLEDPIISIEGGTNLYGHVNGNSINLTVTYWDDLI